ncbi:MAG: hypothetical protein OZSIB_0979 [Candidatus Ozemobacter sibiricus]|uniref:Uncharacterized protein n=1 Tax=Candidatus Ozemobacter sibiricus TaxID=2268124 RepID=A0A367ZM51_9BACT|nr:MAG: hypothetical protein OZSIB_0979 [Candidatus Ozemobacter sibiricus]
MQEDCLVLKPAHHPRAGWDELFEKKKGGASDPELEAWEKMTDADGDEDWAWK